jgi:F-type H+-transporting ATPase subunit delta
MSTVARRYAQAAIDAAHDHSGSAGVEKLSLDLKEFAQLYEGSSDLRETMVNPSLSGNRSSVLKNIATRLGRSDLTASLLLLLDSRARLNLISEISQAATEIADGRLGRARAQVVSALPLSDDQTKRISAALQARFGKPVVFDAAVDSSILGGLVCTIGSTTIDSSLRRQLEIMSERFHASENM